MHGAENHPLPKQTSNDERREKDLQIQAVLIAKICKARDAASVPALQKWGRQRWI
jgi:hypothetical protein